MKYIFRLKSAWRTKSFKVLVFGILGMFVLVIGICTLGFNYARSLGYDSWVLAVNAILIVIIVVLHIYFIIYGYMAAIKSQKGEYIFECQKDYEKYIETRGEIYCSMRDFKEKYFNIIKKMEYYMKHGDMNGLKKYYLDDVLGKGEYNHKSNDKLMVLSNINSIPIKSILSSKIIHAMELGLNTDISIIEPIVDDLMENIDLARILGILFDNAIEAAGETEKKEICMSMLYKDDSLCIYIKNTTLPLKYDIKDLKKQNVSSKGKNRGLGLNIVSEIIDKYDNIVLIPDYQEPYFMQKLIIRGCKK